MLNPNKVQSDRRYGLSRAGSRALDLCFSELRFCINTVPGSASILMKKPKITHFWNSHSLLSRGHTCLVFSQREMQWKWNACCRTKNTQLYYNRKDTVHILISFDWLVDVCDQTHITDSPGHCTLLWCSWRLIGLALYTWRKMNWT